MGSLGCGAACAKLGQALRARSRQGYSELDQERSGASGIDPWSAGERCAELVPGAE
jgi:hypothetical protein